MNSYYNYNRSDLYHQYDYGTGQTISTTPPWVDPDNLLRTWTQTYHGKNKNQGTEVGEPLTLADSAALPLGLYGVEVTSPAAIQNGFLLAVANTSIAVKSAPGGSLLWVTDFASGAPVANAEITSYWKNKTTVLGHTDSSGVLLVPDQAIAQGYLTATQDGSMACGTKIRRTARWKVPTAICTPTDRFTAPAKRSIFAACSAIKTTSPTRFLR
ncbi:MAG: hypothetical protein ABI700_08930 [Chloroflexota bacterium]